MAHEADDARRQVAKDRCGWKFDDDYTVERCRSPHGHSGDHQGYRVHWTERPGNGAMPPAHRNPNEAAPSGRGPEGTP